MKTSVLAGEVRKRLGKIAALLASPAPPDLVLNRHCAECEFQARCRQKALEQDDLSLLAGMSARDRFGPPPEGSSAFEAIKSAVNLLSVIFARVYFPTFSNGLKEIAAFLGFAWHERNPSGLMAIALRTDWERSNDIGKKARVMAYNQQDCEALELGSNAIRRLRDREADNAEVKSGLLDTIQVDALRNDLTTKWDRFKSPLPEFEVINDAAHWDYQRDRVYLRSSRILTRVARRKTAKNPWRVDKVLPLPTQLLCPYCGRTARRKGVPKARIVQDLVFGRNSLKRRVFQYYAQPCWCPHCKVSFEAGRSPGRRHFGRNLTSFLFYQMVELSIPGQVVCRNLNRLFGFNLATGTLACLKEQIADYYRETQRLVLEDIVSGNLVHVVDETFVSIKGKRGYVWVFATLYEVVYAFCETRESDLVQDTLRNFKGVLVSDFYAVYDSLNCPQQKCLIHLIQDLNTELLDHPYDEELKRIVKGFAETARSIIATVDERGLKKHFL